LESEYFRQIRALTQEVTSQFSEELKAFDDINPAKIMNEVTQPVKDLQPKNIAKEIEKSAKSLQPKNIVNQMKDAAEGKSDSAVDSKIRKAQRIPNKSNASKDVPVESENQIMPPEAIDEIVDLEISETVETLSPSANGTSPTENKPETKPITIAEGIS